MLHLTAELDAKLRSAVDDFDFNTYVRALTDFCNEDLSAFYFDIRKDSLYCDAPAIGEAPRLPDRARHPVPRAGALARAGAGVHHRGSVGHALSRRGVGASARMAGGRRRSMPTTRKWAALARASRPGDRGDRAAAPRQGRSDRASRPKSTVPERRGSRTLLAELFITSTVHNGDEIKVDEDGEPQMRALLAPSAGGRRATASCATAARRW